MAVGALPTRVDMAPTGSGRLVPVSGRSPKATDAPVPGSGPTPFTEAGTPPLVRSNGYRATTRRVMPSRGVPGGRGSPG